jgi:SAM-dependent methyltransferase
VVAFRLIVVMFDVVDNGLLELADAGERAARVQIHFETDKIARMRIRDSGMPDEILWESFFDVPLILSKFNIKRFFNVAELGCGFGTFSIPVAKAIKGTLYAYDIDPAMVARTLQKGAGLRITAELRDVMEEGFGGAVDAVLLFNILHCEQPVTLLRHARSVLRKGGEILVIHWRHDIATPRGPALAIRPRPDQIAISGEQSGLLASDVIDLPPWHYGMRLMQIGDRPN